MLSSLLQMSAQETIQIEDAKHNIHIGKNIEVLEDKANNLGIKDILKPTYQAQFKPQGNDIFVSSPSKSAYWFKIVVQNQIEEDIWLMIGDAFNTWEADVYFPDKYGQYKKPKLLGAFRPQSNNELPYHDYCVKLFDKGEKGQKVFYLRVYSEMPSIYAFQVGSIYAVTKKLNYQTYIIYAFLGLIVSMISYNLFLFYSSKEQLYLIYALFLLFVSHATITQNGHPIFNHPWLWKNYTLIIIPGYFLTSLFISRYLELKKNYLKFYYHLWALTFVIIIICPIIALLFGIYSIMPVFQLFMLLYFLSLISNGIYAWYQGNKNARFYTIGWSFSISGVFVFLFTINGYLPFNILTKNISYIGLSLESILFAFALGNKLSVLKKENEKVQAENLRIVTEQNKTLEEKVHERTLNLQEANEELQVMNEELRQTQEELQAQRDFVEEQNQKLISSEQILRKVNDKFQQKNKELQSSYQKINSSIKVAKAIQKAVLPYQDKLDSLLKEYFVINRPKDIVSGDFYWLNEIEGKIVLVVADCTGHGVPGAFMTLIGANLLDKIIRIWKITNPAEILNILHEEIRTVLHQKNTDNNNGMDAIALTLEVKPDNTKLITFAGAKNNLLYFHQSELKELKGTRKSIGGIQNERIKFENQEILLDNDSIVYLGSDGLEDQNNYKRKKFGRKNLVKLLNEINHLQLNEQANVIEQTLDSYSQNTNQRDDILWLGFRV